MTRRSTTLRLLLPLLPLVTGVDVTLASGPAARTCPEAAGRGWMGIASRPRPA